MNHIFEKTLVSTGKRNTIYRYANISSLMSPLNNFKDTDEEEKYRKK